VRIVVIALALTAGACHGDIAGDAKDGPELFARTCSMCHGAHGKPDATMVARLGVRDLTAPEFRARVTPAVVEHQIRAGSQNKLMPSFEGAITDAQIQTLANFVASPSFH
jgi:mono/diheme cytochrome c family protein